jgi:hypothetical protein
MCSSLIAAKKTGGIEQQFPARSTGGFGKSRQLRVYSGLQKCDAVRLIGPDHSNFKRLR